MKKNTLRKYECFYDNGRDFCDFYFTSEHRCGSKANLEDAKMEMYKRYGYLRSLHWKIMTISLVESY